MVYKWDIKRVFFKLGVDEFIRNDLKKNEPPPPLLLINYGPDRREDQASMASIHCNGSTATDPTNGRTGPPGAARSAWGTEDCNDPSMVAAIGCAV